MSRRLFQFAVVVAFAIGAFGLGQPAALQGQGPKGTEPPKDKSASEPELPADANSTIGLLSGLYLYQTYLNIGFIADCKAKNVYEANDAKLLLVSILAPLERVDKQLEKYGKVSTDKDEKEAIAKVRAIVATLREQGKYLQAFWENEKEEVGAKYEKARKEAWDAISKLTGIETP